MNALASALLGEEVELFIPIKHRYSGKNVVHLSLSTLYEKRNKSEEAYAEFTVVGRDGLELFAYFPTDQYTGADCYLNGERIGRHFVREQSGYLALGSYETGEECTLSFRLEDEGIYMKRNVNYFYAMDRAVYDRLITVLSGGGYRVTECTEDSFKGSITVREGYTTVLTTIPYDKGWRITVDGREIEGRETLDALLCFELPVGEHTLELRYMPDEYILAFRIFLGGVGLFAAIVAAEYLIKKQRLKRSAASADGKESPLCITTSEEN